MPATIIPNGAVTVDGKPSITGYIVEKWDIKADGNIDMEDIKDGAGAQHSRIIFEKRMATVEFEVIVTTGDGTEFTSGAMCTVSGYTDYFVQATRQQSKSATRIVGTLERITFS